MGGTGTKIYDHSKGLVGYLFSEKSLLVTYEVKRVYQFECGIVICLGRRSAREEETLFQVPKSGWQYTRTGAENSSGFTNELFH